MALVTVKNKFQIVIPQHVREELGVAIGDILEATAVKGKIVFAPKAVVDRGILESIAEFKEGKGHGPFATHKQFLASLHKETRKLTRRKTKTRAK